MGLRFIVFKRKIFKYKVENIFLLGRLRQRWSYHISESEGGVDNGYSGVEVKILDNDNADNTRVKRKFIGWIGDRPLSDATFVVKKGSFYSRQ